MRTWLSQAEGYLPAVEIGEAVRASGIGRVVATRCPTLPLGHAVYGLPGWQRYAVVRDDALTTDLGTEVDAPAMLSVYGATGLTAYVGMVDVGQVREGETVVVSAAAGATGSLAAQIAKLHGCRVIGICGTEDKARWLLDDLGLDGAIVHRTDDVRARLKELCPDRVDVYFDNVGGPLLEAVLDRLAMHARVVLCGSIAIYNETRRPPGPANYFQLINRRARMEGFLSLDHWDRFGEVSARLGHVDRRGPAALPHRDLRGARQCGRRPQRAVHRRQHRQDRDPGVAARPPGRGVGRTGGGPRVSRTAPPRAGRHRERWRRAAW